MRCHGLSWEKMGAWQGRELQIADVRLQIGEKSWRDASEGSEGGALVQAAAVGAAGEEVVGGVFELEGAEGAAETVLESLALDAQAADVPDDPIGEDQGEEAAEIDEDHLGQGSADHGEASGSGVVWAKTADPQ
jgi:hypothetical protein